MSYIKHKPLFYIGFFIKLNIFNFIKNNNFKNICLMVIVFFVDKR